MSQSDLENYSPSTATPRRATSRRAATRWWKAFWEPGYPECVALIVQIGDHLSKQYDVKG